MGLFGSLINLAFGGAPDMLPWEDVNVQAEQSKAIAGNEAALPAIQRTAGKVNTFNQSEIARMMELAMPGYAKMRDKGTNMISDWMSGKIPGDVSNAVQSNAAARSLYGGYGGSGMGRNLVARDLGLTSLDLMSKGLGSAERWIAQSRTLAPTMDVTSMFIRPEFQAQFASAERDKKLGYGNTKRQFEYATDPMRGVESSVADLGDTIGTALSVYMGGMGGLGSAAGGLMGMGSGGGSGSGVEMLTGFFGQQGAPNFTASQSNIGGKGGFNLNPKTGFFE